MPVSKSQRIKLLTSIANKLSQESWAVIDLTLGQFELPTQDSWSSGENAYILAMAKGASDENLLALAEHLDIPIDKGSSSAPSALHPTFWKPEFFRLFVSHLASHRKFAAELQEGLEWFGISSFVAHNDIEPTKEWQTEIEVALTTCDGLVALLHENFHQSNWTDQEVGFAMGRGVPIFSVGLGQSPYGFIGKFQAFNGTSKKPWELAREVFDAIRKHKQTQQRMAQVLVHLFEKSPSFDAAKARIGYLEELDVWDASFAKRVATAAETNGQISGAWGVSDRVSALIKKWKQ